MSESVASQGKRFVLLVAKNKQLSAEVVKIV